MASFARIHIIPILIFLIIAITACSEENINRVDIKQIEIDGSTNDRYLFKEEIMKEKLKENRYKKDSSWK